MAEGCVRNSAPVIPIAKTKAGRMIFITLVCRKGSEGCLILWGKSVAEAGNAVSNFRSSWHNSLSPCPQRCSTPQCKCMLWCAFFYFFCPFYNSLSELSPVLFILLSCISLNPESASESCSCNPSWFHGQAGWEKSLGSEKMSGGAKSTLRCVWFSEPCSFHWAFLSLS